MSYPAQSFPLPIESLNCDAIAKATRKPPTEADLARGRQRDREKLPDELDRINDLISFHSLRAEQYGEERDSITAKVASVRAAISELMPLAPTRGSIRNRIAQLEEQIASLQAHEFRVAESELDKHSRLLAVNRKLRQDFPLAEPKAFLKEQAILAKAGLFIVAGSGQF